MTVEVLALALTLLVHVIGAGVLIWALVDGSFDWRELWPRDDDGGGGSGPERPDPREPDGGGGIAPLPDAQSSPVRLREPGRIAERYPRPTRRPEHAPEQPRVPVR